MSHRVLFFAFLIAFSTPALATIEQAQTFYDQNLIAKARQGFQAAGDKPANAQEKAESARGLARIAWLVDGDFAKADALLSRRYGDLREDCANAAILARYRERAGRGAEMDITSYKNCRAFSSSYADIVAYTALKILDQPGKGPARAAMALLRPLPPMATTSSDVERARLSAAIRLQNVSDALMAWRAFFWVTSQSEATITSGASAAHLFAIGAGPGSSAHDRIALANFLMRLGFHDASQWIIAETSKRLGSTKNRALTSVKACLGMENGVVAMTEADDKRIAHGEKQSVIAQVMSDQITTLFQKADRQIKDAVRQPGDGPIWIVAQRCNFVASFGFTGGFPSAHIGHIVHEEKRTLREPGTEVAVHFELIDNMVSNGFQSWLWDGDQATGGWSSEGAITQVRGPYVKSAIADLELLPGTQQRREIEQKIQGLQVQDRVAAASGHATYLPGVAELLRIQTLDEIQAAVTKNGKFDPLTFAHFDLEQTIEHSIWLHEGRHALDAKRFKDKSALAPADLEYRAKLTELAFARFPRDAFGAINNSLVGEHSGHGQANERILEDYRVWIGAHAQEIAGYDRIFPALFQLPKLSDAQIRRIAKQRLFACCAIGSIGFEQQ